MGKRPRLQDEEEEEEEEEGDEIRVGREHTIWQNDGVIRNQAGRQTIRGSMHTAPVYNQSNTYFNSAPSTSKGPTDLASPEDALKELLESLTFERMDARLRNIAFAHSSTCKWLFSHPTFRDWNDCEKTKFHHGFLWIRGKPGSGKSVTMKTILNWVKENRKGEDIASYFFNARAPGVLEKSSLGFYRFLAYQLLKSYPATQKSFFEQFALKRRNGKIEDWTANELQDFIRYIIRTLQGHRLNLLIDALDEGDETDVRRMIVFLEELALDAISSGSPIRICLASRYYPHISIPRCLSLPMDHESGHQDDIRTYVQSKLSGYDSQEDQSRIDELKDKICEKSAGIFLWVVLVVPMLRAAFDHGGGIGAMTDCLTSIPEELDDLFANLLERSGNDAESIEESLSLFQWVMFAKRPLAPRELFHAVKSSVCTEFHSATSNDMIHRYLVSRSWGLVEVTNATEPVIQFIHETVQGFLKGRGLVQIIPSISGMLEGLSHEKLRTVCLQCIKQSTAGISVMLTDCLTVSSSFPLVSYAVCYLLEHADDAESFGISQRYFLSQFLQQDHHNFLAWLDLYDMFRIHAWPEHISGATLLYILARKGLNNLIKIRVGALAGIDISNQEFGDALWCTVETNNAETTRILVEHGANVNTQRTANGTVLYMASDMGHIEIVRLLIEHGANVDSRTGQYGTALFAASHSGHMDVVRHLIKHEADMNIHLGRYGTALYEASRLGYIEIAQLLIEHGADINVQGGKYGTALQAASFWGRIEVVRLLIQNGADVNSWTEEHGTVLGAALRWGRKEIARLLIEYGAEVNVQEKQFGTLLRMASSYVYTDMA